MQDPMQSAARSAVPAPEALCPRCKALEALLALYEAGHEPEIIEELCCRERLDILLEDQKTRLRGA